MRRLPSRQYKFTVTDFGIICLLLGCLFFFELFYATPDSVDVRLSWTIPILATAANSIYPGIRERISLQLFCDIDGVIGDELVTVDRQAYLSVYHFSINDTDPFHYSEVYIYIYIYIYMYIYIYYIYIYMYIYPWLFMSQPPTHI